MLCRSSVADPSAPTAAAGEASGSDAPAPAAEAASPVSSAAAAAAEAAPPSAVRISRSSEPGKVAGYVLARLNEDPDTTVQINAVGPSACLIATKALAFSRNSLLSARRVSLQFQPQFYRAPAVGSPAGQQHDEDDPEAPRMLSTISLYASVAAVDPSDTPAAAGTSGAAAAAAAEAETVFRVSRTTRVGALAEAISRRTQEKGSARISAVGADAVYIALQALSLARRRTMLNAERDLTATAEWHSSLAAGAAAAGSGGDAGEEAAAATPAPAAAAAAEGDEKRNEPRTYATFDVTLCDPRPGTVARLRRSAMQRDLERGGRGRDGGRGAGRGGPRRDRDTVTVSKKEWEGVKEQLDIMTHQTEQLLDLLAQQGDGGKAAEKPPATA